MNLNLALWYPDYLLDYGAQVSAQMTIDPILWTNVNSEEIQDIQVLLGVRDTERLIVHRDNLRNQPEHEGEKLPLSDEHVLLKGEILEWLWYSKFQDHTHS